MMLPRGAKPLWIALLLSVLAHLAVLLGPQLRLPEWKPAPILTVDLPPPPAPKPAPPKPTPKPALRKPMPPIQPAPPPAVAAAPEPELEPPAPEPPAPEPPAQPPQVASEPPPAPIAPPSLAEQRQFPKRVEIVYSVHRGDHGIRLGYTTHKWHISGGRYLLTSSTEATGLAALFFSGRYLLTSSGLVTSQGLQPKSFWIQRGQRDNRTEYAEFDWNAKTLDYGKSNDRHNVAIADGAQDQLSVFYQLALTAPHRDAVQLDLTTGRKFNHYVYRVVGEEWLDTPAGKLRTQHLTRVLDNPDRTDGSDIWLAADYYYLPVRFRLGTRDGEALDHWIAGITIGEPSEAATAENPPAPTAP